MAKTKELVTIEQQKEITRVIAAIVASTNKIERQDRKDELIAVVDEITGGDWNKRRLLMGHVERQLAEAYV